MMMRERVTRVQARTWRRKRSKWVEDDSIERGVMVFLLLSGVISEAKYMSIGMVAGIPHCIG